MMVSELIKELEKYPKDENIEFYINGRHYNSFYKDSIFVEPIIINIFRNFIESIFKFFHKNKISKSKK